MKKLLGKKIGKNEKLPTISEPKEVTLTDSDYQLKKLFKKGVNFMADEKLEGKFPENRRLSGPAHTRYSYQF